MVGNALVTSGKDGGNGGEMVRGKFPSKCFGVD
jgi:hypothetical protein